MKKLYLFTFVLTSLMFIGQVSAQDCSELFISEYVEGSGNNKGVEIYNPTDNTIELKHYLVARYSNGGTDFTSGGITRLTGTIAPGETHVLVNGQTTGTETSPACDPAMQALADQLDGNYPAPTYMNGNDAIALFKDASGSSTNPADYEVVDLFGIVAGGMQRTDLGWTNFTNQYTYKNIYSGDEITGKDSVLISNYIVPTGYYWLPWSANHSLTRKANITKGITIATMPLTEFNVGMEWDTVPGGVDVWTNLGSHKCDCHSTALEAASQSSSIKVFPNPSSEKLHIESPDLFFSIELYTTSGQLIYSNTFISGVHQHSISLHGKSFGIHLIKLSTTSGEVSRKIIIQ